MLSSRSNSQLDLWPFRRNQTGRETEPVWSRVRFWFTIHSLIKLHGTRVLASCWETERCERWKGYLVAQPSLSAPWGGLQLGRSLSGTHKAKLDWCICNSYLYVDLTWLPKKIYEAGFKWIWNFNFSLSGEPYIIVDVLLYYNFQPFCKLKLFRFILWNPFVGSPKDNK